MASGMATGRAFIVGCPRSGTTLLQSLLFAHPDVYSLPETFFFLRAVPRAGRRRRLGIAAVRAPEALAQLAELGAPARPTRVPRIATAQYTAAFVDALDDAARAHGATLWLEKTPDHLTCVADITRYVAGAKFIHLIRGGEAVVASLSELSRAHPTVWRIRDSPAELAERWAASVRRSAEWTAADGHVLVSFEHLVSSPTRVLAGLLRFLGLDAAAPSVERLLADYRDSSAGVTGRLDRSSSHLIAEPWKAKVAGPIYKDTAPKFDTLFSPGEREQIREIVAATQPVVDRLPLL